MWLQSSLSQENNCLSPKTCHIVMRLHKFLLFSVRTSFRDNIIVVRKLLLEAAFYSRVHDTWNQTICSFVIHILWDCLLFVHKCARLYEIEKTFLWFKFFFCINRIAISASSKYSIKLSYKISKIYDIQKKLKKMKTRTKRNSRRCSTSRSVKNELKLYRMRDLFTSFLSFLRSVWQINFQE